MGLLSQLLQECPVFFCAVGEDAGIPARKSASRPAPQCGRSPSGMGSRTWPECWASPRRHMPTIDATLPRGKSGRDSVGDRLCCQQRVKGHSPPLFLFFVTGAGAHRRSSAEKRCKSGCILASRVDAQEQDSCRYRSRTIVRAQRPPRDSGLPWPGASCYRSDPFHCALPKDRVGRLFADQLDGASGNCISEAVGAPARVQKAAQGREEDPREAEIPCPRCAALPFR